MPVKTTQRSLESAGRSAIGIRLYWRFAALLVLILSVGAVAHATAAPQHSVVASGGTVSALSSTHRVSGTIGQVSSTRAQSPTTTVAGGFWNTLGVCKCPHIGDLDTNSVIDILDVIALINVAFRGGPTPPGDPQCPITTRADLNCDSVVDILDVISSINTAFRNVDDRCNPCLQ